MSNITIPGRVLENLGRHEEGRQWLSGLPDLVSQLVEDWSLRIEAPFETEVSGAWVARCSTAEGHAVLKLGWPHFEARDEIDGLRAWQGEGSVRLLRFDRSRNAMLLEACDPGLSLRSQPADIQDRVLCDLLKRLWQTPAPAGLRSLASMITYWVDGAQDRQQNLPRDAQAVMARGHKALHTLARSGPSKLLTTDLHAGNVLSAQREPWLMIDPKPFIGDPCYDLTQHLMNVKPRLGDEGQALVDKLADWAGVDPVRLRRWIFGRLCLQIEDLDLAREVDSWSGGG